MGFNQPPSIRDQVLAAIRYHVENARNAEAETFDEADDFEIDEDAPPEFGRGHELPADVVQLETWNDKSQKGAAIKAAHERFLKANPDPAKPEPPADRAEPSKKTA